MAKKRFPHWARGVVKSKLIFCLFDQLRILPVHWTVVVIQDKLPLK
jgi:hypothetical protein